MPKPDLDKLKDIWLNTGSHPAYHRAQINRLKRQWPLLYKWLHDTFGEPKY